MEKKSKMLAQPCFHVASADTARHQNDPDIVLLPLPEAAVVVPRSEISPDEEGSYQQDGQGDQAADLDDTARRRVCRRALDAHFEPQARYWAQQDEAHDVSADGSALVTGSSEPLGKPSTQPNRREALVAELAGVRVARA